MSRESAIPLLFIDSDIFVLLAGATALEPVIEFLGFDLRSSRRLAALPYMLRKETYGRTYQRETVQRALSACARVEPFVWDPSPDLTHPMTLLAGRRRIDPGEVQLIARTAADPGSYLLSGDKGWMKELCAQQTLRGIRDSIAGRVVCLEAALELLLDRLGPQPTIELFAPIRNVSPTLRVIFSAGKNTREQDCWDALRAYLDELEAFVGPDFLYRPSWQRS